MKKLVFSILFVLQVAFVWAQQKPSVTGKVVDSKTLQPLQNVTATLLGTNQTVTTDNSGSFVLKDVAKGNQTVVISYDRYTSQTFALEIKDAKPVDLGMVILEEDVTSEQQMSLITITENDLGDDNSGSESTSGILQASRDTYQQIAAFNWGQARYRIRGLDNEYGRTMINGVVMNKLYDGRPQWSNWGGLNDATRNQEFTMGTAASDYTFGGILGTQQINTRASYYRPGSRVSFSGTNTNYSWRTMATHASGMNTNGWAFVVSASRRWAQEGNFEGTDYSANSVFASVEKKLGKKHSLNFTSILAENSRGKNSPNTKEVADIAGTKYNAYWGWQDGKKRNSRDKDVMEPIMMLSHYWKMSDKTNLNTNVAVQTGSVGNSRLDYQGVNNPDPTYYRNLPSYFTSLYENDPTIVNQTNPGAYLPGGLGGLYTPNLVGAANANFLSQPQLDWDMMYHTNTLPSSAGKSFYILAEDRTDDTQWTANSILNSQLSDNITLNAGANFRSLKSHNYKTVIDLLGGTYFEDVNTFGTNYNQTQSDLNNPNRTVAVGDRYSYNYNIYANVYDAFTQFKFNYKKVDFYLSQSFSRSEYQRDGLYKNGYYPTNSFGKSEKMVFDNFGFKGGLTYKLSGSHMFTINALYMSKAPTVKNTFANVRINNNVVDNIKSESVGSADISYVVRTPKFKGRLTAFYSDIQNATETSFYFADGVSVDDGNPDTVDAASNFVAETVTNIEKQNMGLELGMEYQITSTITAKAAASYGQYTYNNNPNVSLNIDSQATAANPYPVASFGKAHLKDLRQPGMPQQAVSFGLEYRDPKFWWVGANINYLAGNYIDVAPIIRTDHFFLDSNGNVYPEATQERARQLLKQEKFDDFALLNLTGGKSWKIGKQTFGFFATINNVLDVTYKTGGYEQARNATYRDLNQDVSSGTPAFAPKYFYGYGRTYFVNLYINF